MNLDAPSAPRSGILLLGVLVAVAGAYAKAPFGPFAWDDRPLILESPATHSLRPDLYLSKAFWHARPTGQADAAYYRPATTTSFAIDWWLSGGSPALFHLTNVLLHLGMVALVYFAGISLGAPSLLAALSALLFGLAPRLTESVAWISGRTDILASLFALGAILLYVRPEGSGARHRPIGASLLLLFGLLAKEVGAAAFVGMTAAEWSRRRVSGDSVKDALVRLTPPAAAVATYLALRAYALRGLPPPASISLGEVTRLVAPFDALSRYFFMVIDPLRPRLQIGELADAGGPRAVIGAVLAVGLMWILVRGMKQRPAPLAAALAATGLSALALVLHVYPLRVSVVAADRFLYLPLACLFPLGAIGAARLGRRGRQTVLALGALLALASFWATSRRVNDWLDEVQLWSVAVDTAPPSNTLARAELANALDRAGRPDEALAEYRWVAARSHGKVRLLAEGNIAGVLSAKGEHARAAEVYETMVKIEPDVALHRYNLAIVYARLLDFDAAERELVGAIAILREYPEAERALRIVREIRSAWTELPAPRPREPATISATRASLLDRLGAREDASIYWRRVMDDPDASRAQRAQASGRLGRDSASTHTPFAPSVAPNE